MPKYAGGCSMCFKPVFDVLRTDANGLAKRIGKPLHEAQRLHFVLADGSTMALTFCGQCAADLAPVHYPVIWQNVLEAFKLEIDALNERDPDHHAARVAAASRLAANVPLGVVATERWSDVIGERSEP